VRGHVMDAGKPRASRVIDGDYTPRSQINIWPKDLGIVLDIAKDAGSARRSPRRRFSNTWSVGMGMGAEDDAAITRSMRAMPG
jgi:putative dehydrogenase